MRLTVLGTRGSMTVSNREMQEFGGSTSAYMIEEKGQVLLIDGGSGLQNVPRDAGKGEPLSLLFTHTHLDHILGLPFFLPEVCSGRRLDIYGRTRDGEDVEKQLDHLFSAPLWPVSIRECSSAELVFHEIKGASGGEFRLGHFHIRWMEGNHPGGCLVYRVEAGGKSLVLATDFEHGGGNEDRLAEFASGTDLLLYDAQYTEREYILREGYGHSTAEYALKVFAESRAKSLRLVHHDLKRTDRQLREMEARMGTPRIRFAREGETVEL